MKTEIRDRISFMKLLREIQEIAGSEHQMVFPGEVVQDRQGSSGIQ